MLPVLVQGWCNRIYSIRGSTATDSFIYRTHACTPRNPVLPLAIFRRDPSRPQPRSPSPIAIGLFCAYSGSRYLLNFVIAPFLSDRAEADTQRGKVARSTGRNRLGLNNQVRSAGLHLSANVESRAYIYGHRLVVWLPHASFRGRRCDRVLRLPTYRPRSSDAHAY
ncbi:hypothetical protein SVAN01_08293 [Stagonosporopsis vannaccii]|nr:hypothetical protein SVAN01_08293 [Stagonosporopsis vannaccii]